MTPRPAAVYVARGGFLPGTAFYGGGVRGDTNIDDGRANDRFFAYEPRQNVREEMAEMPLMGLEGIGSAIEQARCWLGLEAVGDGLDATIFAYGGGTHGKLTSDISKVDPGTVKPDSEAINIVTRRVDEYLPNEDEWRTVGEESLPAGVFNFAHTSFWNENGKWLYLFGGAEEDGTIRSQCHKGTVSGDPSSVTWESINSPVVPNGNGGDPVALWGHVAARVGNEVFLFGGVADDGDGGEEMSPRIFKGTINTSTGDITWESGPLDIGTAGEGPDLVNFFHMAAAVVDGKVYLYGGRRGIGESRNFGGGEMSRQVIVFDPEEATAAQKLSVFTATADWPVGSGSEKWGQSGAIGLGLTDNDEVDATAGEEVDPDKVHIFGGRSHGGTVYAEHHVLNVVRTDGGDLSGADWRTGARNPIRLVGHAGCRAGILEV